MMKLQTKLALFNLLSKLVFSALFIGFLPLIIERINTRQTDNELIKKREEVISLISAVGIEPFIVSDTTGGFGSYNILKEEYISLERAPEDVEWNFIDVTKRIIDNETIDYRVLHYSLKIDGESYLLEIGMSLASITYAARNIRNIILVFLGVFILVTLISDLTYTARILRPLRVITGRLGNTSLPTFDHAEPLVTSTEDFVKLDRTLREMMRKIGELFRKEREITVNISHELMTPVSVLRSKLENMLMRENLDPAVESGLEESLRTLHRLKTLVNSMLMIARIESSQYMKEEIADICELVKEVTSELAPLAEDGGVTLILECEQIFMAANVNRSLLFSMIYNVVNNAVKHTPSGGRIEIAGRERDGRFELSVSDTGKGMSPEQLDRLFTRFSNRPDPAGNSTGIGLAITKSIADFHNIAVRVISVPGAGTQFFFFFPVNSL
ncbi:MAG: HAMP domain-containing histidine kinase [Bacteroidales bacterium]|jgi:signal transduction histidine kinase|nr:HAMP domain-containing histidine kinase [Bacteroidales bacterium]